MLIGHQLVKKMRDFMEHESLLPCSYDPANGPYVQAHIPCFNFPQTFEKCFKSSILYLYLHFNGRNAPCFWDILWCMPITNMYVLVTDTTMKRITVLVIQQILSQYKNELQNTLEMLYSCLAKATNHVSEMIVC
jgi:hypothetical protein